MNARVAKVAAWSIFAATTILASVQPILGFARPSLENFPRPTAVDVSFLIAFWLFSPVGAVIASRVRGNPIGWIMLWIAFFEAFAIASFEYSTWAVFYRPGSLPAGKLTAWFGMFMWAPGLGLMPWLMLLFPTGRFLSHRWRLLAYPSVLAVGVMAIIAIFHFDVATELASNPDLAFPDPLLNRVAQASIMSMFAALVGSMVGFIVRFRRSRDVERQQLKWLAYPAGCAAVLLVINVFLAGLLGFEESTFGNLVEFLLNLSAMALPVATGIAILRHRLFDIDVIINKTLVYGALVALITTFYLGVVIGLGTVLGGGSNLPLSIAATAVIAVAFQPLRRRLQSVGNRLVYGQRVTPYEAMAEFSHQMAAAPSVEEVLPRIAEVAARGIGASVARVSILLADGSSRSAHSPDGPGTTSFDVSVPITHRGEDIGEIAICKQRGESITETEKHLIANLASQAGPTLRNVRLTEELRASRQRLVAAQDEERRRMERDIHDGAQQQLVAMAVKLGLAERLVDKDPPNAKRILSEVKAESNEALETLRDLARGLFPAALADKGLTSAVEAHVAKMNLNASVHTDSAGGRRFNPNVEAAVYFCIREALQNASKHAGQSKIAVDFGLENGSLSFSVVDEGPGFELSGVRLGSGLQNMKDRIEAIGGELNIESSPGAGTRVRGHVPIAGKAQ